MNLDKAVERFDQAVEKLVGLNTGLDRLLEGVKVESAHDSLMHGIEQGHNASLRSFLGTLLIDNPASAQGTVWPLLENRVNKELMADPIVMAQKGFLSSPLEGSPTDVLKRLRIMEENSPWHTVCKSCRENLSKEQVKVIRLLDESLT